MSRASPPEAFDAVVIGAGPSGATAALALAGQGLAVAVVERAAFPRRKVCGEFVSATSMPVLASLGLAEEFARRAGPPVRRLALFAGPRVVEAPAPPGGGADPAGGLGRALGRDVLDALALDRAREAGCRVLQPARATAFERGEAGHVVHVEAPDGPSRLAAPVLVAAHGSWERGPLPTQLPKSTAPADLLGFKSHFAGGRLAAGLMPLLAFPGGYGGMVEADRGRLSLSLCIRRDALAAIREAHGLSAAEAVQRHVAASCRGAREALEGAELEGAWLATGPVRPGVRPCHAGDVFRVGNVAGESHSIIAEGISMGIQSGWLLARALEGRDIRDPEARGAAGAAYARAWRAQFAGRIRAAGLFAGLAARPGVSAPLAALVAALPRTLTLGARLSGKTKPVATDPRPAA